MILAFEITKPDLEEGPKYRENIFSKAQVKKSAARRIP